MILKSLKLADWKHLAQVRIEDLSPGINVIYGPNKAGKSTIAQALRIALIDYDHSSKHADVAALTPWSNSSAIPTAEVGLIKEGKVWRLEKRFTSKKGGGASLREHGAGIAIAEDKNVTTEARRLLGIQKSGEGLGSLLWPEQGFASMPGVDATLSEALRKCLGILVSDDDVRFQRKLDDTLSRWYTPAGKEKDSFARQEEAITNQRGLVSTLRGRRAKYDALIAEYEIKKAERVKALADVEKSRKTIAELEARLKGLEGKKQKIKDIQRDQSGLIEKRQRVESDIEDLLKKETQAKDAQSDARKAELAIEAPATRLAELEEDLREANEVVDAIEQRAQALETRKLILEGIKQQQNQNEQAIEAANAALVELRGKQSAAKNADAAAESALHALKPLEEKAERQRKSLKEADLRVQTAEASDLKLKGQEARAVQLRALAQIEESLSGMHSSVETALETTSRLSEIANALSGIGPGEDADVEQVQQLLTTFRDAEAALAAMAMTITLTPISETDIEKEVDGGSATSINITAGSSSEVNVLERAELRLRGWGTVTFQRPGGSLAEQRAALVRSRSELSALGVKLDLTGTEQSKWISEIVSRKATREAKTSEQAKLTKELKKQAPAGVQGLTTELRREEKRLTDGKKSLGLKEDASIANEVVALGELEARRSECNAELAASRANQTDAREELEKTTSALAEASKQHQNCEGRAQSARVLLQDAVKRTGGEDAIKKQLEGLAASSAALAEQLNQAQLTDEEVRLPELLVSARGRAGAMMKQRDMAANTHKKAIEQHNSLKSKAASALAVLEGEIKRTGGESALRKKLETAAEEEGNLLKQLATFQLTPEEEGLEKAHSDERKALTSREQRERDVERRINEIDGELKGAEGLHGQLAAAEQKLSEMEGARKREKLDAEAHKLIADWFKEERDRATESSLEPVANHVKRWLRILNGGENAGVAFNGSSLGAEALKIGSQSLEIENATSYGEREQLGTLVRLAYACVLAKEEPQSVILDDPLAHSDATRHRRMLDVLADAAKHNLQLIILTCHPERFDQLDAHQVDLEKAKQEEA
ncbi:MAG: hypothetical protein BroJett014_22050 [Planctomycetota bacterium]|nr:MAG: hypothetical protein BroJett014_22050 [Planctomycetota bacterium]